jgi:D-alanine-D-alanine ligase-like ATP-grasp enzyme
MYLEEASHDALQNLVFPPIKLSFCFEYKCQPFNPIVSWLKQVSPQIWAQLPEALKLTPCEVVDNRHTYFSLCISAVASLICFEVNCPIFRCPQVSSIRKKLHKESVYEAVFCFQNVGMIPVVTLQQILNGALHMCNCLVSLRLQEHSSMRHAPAYLKDILSKQSETKMAGHISTTRLLFSAASLGIHYCHLGKGIYRLGWGKNSLLVDRSLCQTDSYMGLSLASDKLNTAKVLKAAGLPVPRHVDVSDGTTVKQFALGLGFPLVIKPVDCERGEGVTVDIYDEQALMPAFALAMKFSKLKGVLIEKQVPGVCHRLFMVKGKLLYAVKRWPPSVFGDGRSTIRQLVERNYQAEQLKLPSLQQPLLPWDDETEQFIIKSGFDNNYIPVIGERISLRRIETSLWGGYDEDVTNKIHPETLRQAKVACGLFQLTVCGVDVITEDISLPLSQTGGVINELNGGPLLGGGAISRAYIPEYLRLLVPNQGKIAVKIFRTNEDDQAEAYLKGELGKGVQCFYCSDTETLDHHGLQMLDTNLTLAQRLRILIFHPEVESLCIVSDYWTN